MRNKWRLYPSDTEVPTYKGMGNVLIFFNLQTDITKKGESDATQILIWSVFGDN